MTPDTAFQVSMFLPFADLLSAARSLIRGFDRLCADQWFRKRCADCPHTTIHEHARDRNHPDVLLYSIRAMVELDSDDINSKDDSGKSILNHLCSGPEDSIALAAIEQLTRSKKLVDSLDRFECSSADRACIIGRTKTFKLLMKSIEPRESSFFLACSNGRAEIVELLLDRLKNPSNMKFAVDAACASNHLAVGGCAPLRRSYAGS